MGAKGGGTFYFNKTGNIYIDPNMVQGSKQFGELTYAQLATVIASTVASRCSLVRLSFG